MRRSSAVSLFVVLITSQIAFGELVHAAEAPGAAKLALVGPQPSFYCIESLAPDSEDVATETIAGFVIFNFSAGTNTLKATVSLFGAEPENDYPVRLIQNTFEQCHEVDAILRTNRNGNGTVNIVEPAVGTAAQILVDPGISQIFPSYRASEAYTWG